MSFRRKNVVLGHSARSPAGLEPVTRSRETSCSAGVRSSPQDGRPTTSTGTVSLDQLLAGHTGLPLGTNTLIEESGTTDFSGIVLRYYAAEGLLHGHQVHVLGPQDSWRAELPGLGKAGASSRHNSGPITEEKMRIAWRYESLDGRRHTNLGHSRGSGIGPADFCHSFDLSKRLQPNEIRGELLITTATPATEWLPLPGRLSDAQAPLQVFIETVSAKMQASAPGTIHRVVVPHLLSPTSYSSSTCQPSDVLQFLHKLRSLLRQYHGRLSALVSMSTSLNPHFSGLTRWMELLFDGVLELLPLPRKLHFQPKSKPEETAQGVVKVHSLPVHHERGGGQGSQSSRENLSFHLSGSSGLVFKPYNLPSLLQGEEAGHQSGETRQKEACLEF